MSTCFLELHFHSRDQIFQMGGAVHRGQTAVGTQICLGHIPSCQLCFRNHFWAFVSGIALGFLLCFAWLLFGQVGDFSSDPDSCLLHDAVF